MSTAPDATGLEEDKPTIPGSDRYWYYAEDTGNLWIYRSGEWLPPMAIRGEAGKNGSDGKDGTNGTDGKDGAAGKVAQPNLSSDGVLS